MYSLLGCCCAVLCRHGAGVRFVAFSPLVRGVPRDLVWLHPPHPVTTVPYCWVGHGKLATLPRKLPYQRHRSTETDRLSVLPWPCRSLASLRKRPPLLQMQLENMPVAGGTAQAGRGLPACPTSQHLSWRPLHARLKPHIFGGAMFMVDAPQSHEACLVPWAHTERSVSSTTTVHVFMCLRGVPTSVRSMIAYKHAWSTCSVRGDRAAVAESGENSENASVLAKQLTSSSLAPVEPSP